MRSQSHLQSAFTLVELLVVTAIIAILAALAAPALSAIKGNEMSQEVYNVSDTLDQARAYALAMNTYVYVGIDQDSSAGPASGIVLGVVASSDGTQVFSSNPTSIAQNSPSIKTISKLLKVSNVQIVSLPAGSPTSGNPRQTVPSNYKVGDPTFDQDAPACSFSLNSYNFLSTPGMTTATGVTSKGIIQINPQGEISEVGGNAVPFFEMGVKPVTGSQSNYAALQIAGLSGAVRIYQP